MSKWDSPDDRLWQIAGECQETANRQGERFNTFRIAKNHRREVTHSRFLGEVLNPRGSHGEGEFFLIHFFREVIGLPEPKGPFTVRREVPTETGRQIDVVVESPAHLVGIEIKVHALDQPNQLQDYHTELVNQADGRDITLMYLTLDGKPAHRDSMGNLADKDCDVVRLCSFRLDIAGWLERCIEASAHKPYLLAGMQQYYQIVKDLTGQGGFVDDLIAYRLQDDSSLLEKAIEIESAVPKAKALILQRFWQDLADEWSGWEDVGGFMVFGGNNLRSISNNYFNKSRRSKDERHTGIKIPVASYGGKKVYLYASLVNWFCYGMRIEDKTGRLVSLSKKDKASLGRRLIDKCGLGNSKANENESWLVSYYFDPRNQDGDNVLKFNKFEDGARLLADKEKCQCLMSTLLAHQHDLAREAQQIFGPLSTSG
ncbi:PD-(D/E)XK nuclease family protein [Guyparkeria sp. 1SP6A2]|nr:PD-(D/E)XK nuclease family protein [Guyparkeria sp. 1SP6A2]